MILFFFKNTENYHMQEVQDKMSEYLFPCIIEYSLMCMTVFFILWESTEHSQNTAAKLELELHSQGAISNNINNKRVFTLLIK